MTRLLSRLYLGYFLLFVISSAASAACPNSALSNGTPANAIDVMAWLDCKAPLINPVFGGNVGVGASSPAALVDLTGNTSTSATAVAIRFTDTNSNTDSRNWLIGNAAGPGYGDLAFIVSPTRATSPSGIPILTLSKNGAVGVNDASPVVPLSVLKNSSSTNDRLASFTASYTDAAGYIDVKLSRSNSSETNSGGIVFSAAANGGGLHEAAAIYTFSDSGSASSGNVKGALVFATANGSSAYANNVRMYIAAGGNVGMGTTSPAQKLDVAGTIRQSGCTTAGTLSANTSGDIICTSDRRLKNLLGAYSGGLNELTRIVPQRFTYKPTKSNPVETFVHAGFIAQNVRAVIPEASAKQRDGYYSLDTTAVLAAAVNAIKQLKTEVDAQRIELEQLRAASAKQAARSRQRETEFEKLTYGLSEIKRHAIRTVSASQ